MSECRYNPGATCEQIMTVGNGHCCMEYGRKQLTSDQYATYQSLVARGFSHNDSVNDALDGVEVEDIRREKLAPRDGLTTKFKVRRVRPSSRGIDHTGCRYFVLDPEHDLHALVALRAYADSCDLTQPQLAADLRRWVEALHSELIVPENHDYVGDQTECQRCGRTPLHAIHTGGKL